MMKTWSVSAILKMTHCRAKIVLQCVNVVLVMVTLCHCTKSLHSEPKKKINYLDYPGDINLGALFPIHKQGVDQLPCSDIQKEDGIQPLEAMLFALDHINNDPSILPNITLGVKGYDSCDNPVHAVEQALPLLKGFMARKIGMECQWDDDDHIVGIIGPQTSAVSVQIANLGRLFRVPQVSYLATSVSFCDRKKYPYFFRTVPSDAHQAHAIVKLLETFGWNYASIVHSDSEYGQTGYEELKKVASKDGRFCLAEPNIIYDQHFSDSDYSNLVLNLVGQDQKAKSKKPAVVIVFADRVSAGRLLEAAKRQNIKDEFVWLGSDAWASRESVVEQREEFVEGAIAIQPLRRELPGYKEYFEGLITKRNERNPWFKEYLEVYHNCTNDPDSSHSKYMCNVTEMIYSSPNLSLFRYNQQLYIHFVRDAVYAFAYALHNLHNDACGIHAQPLCPEFRERMYSELDKYLSNVQFEDVEGNLFRFYSSNGVKEAHDGPPRYSIINFQKDANGMYDWQNVGTYYQDRLTYIDSNFKKKYVRRGGWPCRRQKCEVGEIKVPVTDDKCCWECTLCEADEIKTTEYRCEACSHGYMANENRTKCEILHPSYLNYSKPWAAGAIVVACLGIVATMISIITFIAYWDTAVMKASGRELSLILLFGIFLSFLATFVIVAEPSTTMCGLARFAVGFCYTICYAAVVTKTNRLSRIFNADLRPRFTSPLSSTLIAGCLTGVEVVINSVWLMAERPSTDYIVDRGKRILICSGVDNSIVTGLVYPFLLILCATLYAYKTRKLPGGFNETKSIFFTNIVTTIHWFAYVPLYLASTNHEIRAVILAFSLSVSGLVQLCCFFLPKIYIVVCKPEKRERKPQMSRPRKHFYDLQNTPPHSVAVGMADGNLIRIIAAKSGEALGVNYSMSASALNTNFSFVRNLELDLKGNPEERMAGAEAVMDSSAAANVSCKRRPTWGCTLMTPSERPRSRSLSVSRSTQTQDRAVAGMQPPKKITFHVEVANPVQEPAARKDQDGGEAAHSLMKDEGGLQFIDDVASDSSSERHS